MVTPKNDICLPLPVTLLMLSCDVLTSPLHAVSPRSGHRIPTLQRYYMVMIFTLTASLLYADQNLMAPNLSIIAEEFGFNEEEKTK